jgi:hypothetical protein
MYGSKAYPVLLQQPYIDVYGMVASDVVCVDRNGIGVKHGTAFSGTETVDVKTYEWYGIKPETSTQFNSLIVLSNSIIGSDRQIILRIGSVPIIGFVYSVYYDSIIASYVVQAGDTTEDVRDGLKAAIDAESWGTTVTTTNIGLNRIQIDITGTAIDFTTQLGSQKYKKGYYVTIVGVNYIIEQKVSTSGWPTLTTLGASYAYALLIPISGTVESYLNEAGAIYTYTDSVTGSTDILGIPNAASVPFGECIVDQNQQRIWFNDNLAFGEIIKVFEK